MKKYAAGFLFSLLLLCISGCAVVEENITTQEQQTISLSRLENRIAGADPCEPFNRSMFAVTDFCMNYIADPIGRVYCTLLPRPVIECIDNACLNLEFPARAVSSLCRAEWGGALDETIRFLVNSTVGIAGFFDPAKHWLHIYSTESGFDRAFASWGIGRGCIFVLPFSSATNIRSVFGMLFDTAFDGKTYIPYCGWATGLNRVVMAQDKYASAITGIRDPYKSFIEFSLLKDEMSQQLWGYRYSNAAYEKYRKMAEQQKVDNPRFPLPPEKAVDTPDYAANNQWISIDGYYSVDPVTDSIRSVLFKEQRRNDFWYMPLSLFCKDFVCRREIFSISGADGMEKMRYAFWDAPKMEDEMAKKAAEKEQLVILLPGIGGTYLNSTPVAFAELFHLRNAKTVVVNSTFSWQSQACRERGELPGYLPADALFLRERIKEIIDDLKKRKQISHPEITLAGYSFGAMHTLAIADLEFSGEEIGFARYIAVNPPVSLAGAVEKADALCASGADLTPEKLKKDFIDAAGRVIVAANLQLPPAEKSNGVDPALYRIVIPEKESRVIVGLNLRNSMREMLLVSHEAMPLAGIRNRADKIRKNNLYLELDRVTFRNYAEKMLPERFPDIPISRLYSDSDLRSIARTLRYDERIRIFHNCDDFLLSDADRRFLSGVCGRRLVWFSRGGHLGNLYIRKVQDAIADAAVPQNIIQEIKAGKKPIVPEKIKKVRPMK